MGEFNDRLAALRRERGISQPELAEAAEVSADTYRRWEWGKQEPRLGELLKLSQALGVSVEELATGQKPESGAISIRRGDIELNIPATPEGFSFVEAKLKEFSAGNTSREGSSRRKSAV